MPDKPSKASAGDTVSPDTSAPAPKASPSASAKPVPAASPSKKCRIKNQLPQSIRVSVLDDDGKDSGFTLGPHAMSEAYPAARMTRYTLQLQTKGHVRVIDVRD